MKRTLLLALLSALSAATPAQACNIPVFRYALERWRADPYYVVIFHRGPLAIEDQALVQLIEKHIDQGPVNIDLHLVDLDKDPPPHLQKLFDEQKTTDLPCMVVLYPLVLRIPEPVWSGRLTAEAVHALLDSPARREIVKRILRGESAVWLLLESGDPAKDEAAAKVLQEQLPRLEKELKLPERDNSPEDRLLNEDGIPLKIAFSMLRLKKTDPAEQMLVRMLLRSEPDLERDYGSEPMVFPVFGRGRFLLGLIGKGITPDNLMDGGIYLTGACSCEIKRDNPGLDLLVWADWEAGLTNPVVKDEIPPLTGLDPFVPQPAVTTEPAPAVLEAAQPFPTEAEPSPPVGDAPPSRQAAPAEPGGSLVRNVALAAGAAIAILLGAALVVLRGKRPALPHHGNGNGA
jgi:hypothetical protein